MVDGTGIKIKRFTQNNEIISESTRDNEMMVVRGSDGSGNWGLGVNLISKLGLPVYMHDGAYPGYRARYTVWPTRDFGVAIMCNSDDADIKRVVDDIAEVFLLGDGSPAGALPSAPASELPEVDEDDPKYELTVGDRNEPFPELSHREIREATLSFRREEQRQLTTEKWHDHIAERLDLLG